MSRLSGSALLARRAGDCRRYQENKLIPGWSEKINARNRRNYHQRMQIPGQREKHKIKGRKWAADNREATRGFCRKYYRTHREECTAKGRARSPAYSRSHRKEKKVYNLAYRCAHREELKAKARAYLRRHGEEIRARDRARWPGRRTRRGKG